jgi:hypothetical protein
MTTNQKYQLKKYIENGETDKALTFLKSIDTRPERTLQQNSALHLWLNMIESEAENQGVTQNMLIKHTTQLRVTSEWLKSSRPTRTKQTTT